jgi:hypothetical protein
VILLITHLCDRAWSRLQRAEDVECSLTDLIDFIGPAIREVHLQRGDELVTAVPNANAREELQGNIVFS